MALVVRSTANADKYCKPETIASVMTDVNSYLLSKGLTLGPVATSKTSIVLIVDRPVMNWIQITVQGRDSSGNLLWSDKVSDSAWAASAHATGTKSLLNTLAKVHSSVDAHMPSVTPKGGVESAAQASAK